MDAQHTTIAHGVTPERDYDPRYELFFELLQTYANAKAASAKAFPECHWITVYKRIQRDEILYKRYTKLSASLHKRRVENNINSNPYIGKRAWLKLFEEIASGSPVHDACRTVFPERKPHETLREVYADDGLNFSYRDAIHRRKLALSKTPEERAKTYERWLRQKQRLSESEERKNARRVQWAKYAEKKRRHPSWLLRRRMMEQAREESKATGEPIK